MTSDEPSLSLNELKKRVKQIKDGGAIVAPSGTLLRGAVVMLRCRKCNKLLAEIVSAPYRVRCKCGQVEQALAVIAVAS